MSEDIGRQLPTGWDVAPLCDIANVVMGQSPPSETYNRVGEGLPFFQGKAEFTDLYPEVRSWCNAPGKIAEKNNILLSIRAPVGPTNLASDTCCIGRGLAAIQPEDGIDHRYLLYVFRAFSNRLTTQATGTTFRAVSGKQVREFSVPISPTNEQLRIIEKIEELFSDLDAGVAALERVRRNLKRYRASALKAAVEGRLTEAWRADHPNAEPASQLLTRVLKERRRRWEADQLAAYKAKGKTPPKDWKQKYKEPTPLDDSALPGLPDSWAWASMDELLQLGNYGTSVKCTYKADGVPVLRIPNIRRSEIDLADLKFATTEITADFLEAGDILTCRTNGSIDLIGKAAVIRTSFSTPHHFASYLIRLRLVDADLAGYVHRVFGSVHGRRFIEAHAASSAGQHNISLTNLRRFPIPLPPKTEAAVIEESIDEALSIAEAAVDSVFSTRKRADILRQCILKRAFEGKLVPQDPNDEPASVLLDRIRFDREARPKKPRSRVKKRQRKRTKGTASEQALLKETRR